MIKCADHIIDIGPEGGEAGGKSRVEGTRGGACGLRKSYTAKFLKETLG